MTKVYRQRPSEILHLEGSLLSYWVDRGIRLFGSYVENQVDTAGENAARSVKNRKSKEIHTNSARQRTLARLLGDDMAKTNAGYRSV